MEEILELQRRLAEVQEQKASSAFSDRVIVELVNKIIHDYNMPLLYSNDGQEYMTPEHLDEQIQDLIRQRGRIYLIDLPQILSVTLDVIESRMPKILKNNKLTLIKLENEIITATFLNQICEEINEDLQQRSQINLVELTLKYNFTMNFLKEQLISRIESNIIEGNIVGGERLCTLTYQELTRSRFRGILRGATKPLGLSAMAKDFHIDQQVLQHIIEELISAEEIEGKIIGGSFTPNRFQKNQDNIIHNFLKQNNYIEYSLLTKQLFIAKPEETLKQMFKENVIMLDDCAFLKDNLEELKEQILNLLIEEGYTDLSFMFPTILTEADIETIVNKHLSLSEVELDETFIFSHQFLDKCVNSLKDEIIKQLLENPQKSIQEDKDVASDEDEDDNRKKKGPKGGKKQAQASASASARVEKKEKKPSQQQKNAAKKQSLEKGNSLFSEEEFIEALLKTGVLKKEDRDEIFQTKLYNSALPRLQKYIEQLRKEMLDKKKSVQADAIEQYSQLLDDSILIAQVTQNSIYQIEKTHSDINVTLFSTNLQYALRLIIENSIVLICKKLAISLPQGLFIKKDEEDANKNILMVSFQIKKVFKNKDMLSQAISLLPKEYSQFLTKAYELYLRKKTEPLLEFLLSHTHLIGVRGILDKKIEKNLLLTSKYYLKDLIKKDKTDLKLSFQRLVFYLLIDKCNLCLVGNTEKDELFASLTVVLGQFSRQAEDIHTHFMQTLSGYKLVCQDINEEGVEAFHLARIKFESSLQNLIKASKM